MLTCAEWLFTSPELCWDTAWIHPISTQVCCKQLFALSPWDRTVVSWRANRADCLISAKAVIHREWHCCLERWKRCLAGISANGGTMPWVSSNPHGCQWSAMVVVLCWHKLTRAIADRHKSALILILALSCCLRGDNSVKLAESDSSDSELVTSEDALWNGVLHDIWRGLFECIVVVVVVVVVAVDVRGCDSLFRLLGGMFNGCPTP